MHKWETIWEHPSAVPGKHDNFINYKDKKHMFLTFDKVSIPTKRKDTISQR